MCRDHWYSVPLPLRRAVNRTWRAYLCSDGREQTLAAISAYRKASDEAVAYAAKAQAPVVD